MCSTRPSKTSKPSQNCLPLRQFNVSSRPLASAKLIRAYFLVASTRHVPRCWLSQKYMCVSLPAAVHRLLTWKPFAANWAADDRRRSLGHSWRKHNWRISKKDDVCSCWQETKPGAKESNEGWTWHSSGLPVTEGWRRNYPPFVNAPSSHELTSNFRSQNGKLRIQEQVVIRSYTDFDFLSIAPPLASLLMGSECSLGIG